MRTFYQNHSTVTSHRPPDAHALWRALTRDQSTGLARAEDEAATRALEAMRAAFDAEHPAPQTESTRP
jgi:hypothetical protein